MISREQLDYATNNTAWKTPSMRGFIFKTVLDETIYGAGAYKLTLRKAANNAGAVPPVPFDYDFYFNVDTSVYTDTIPNATNCYLTRELLGHIMNSNWIQGTYADFEAARTGSGGDW